jgi:biopolymer transport protein ExbD
MRFKDTKQEELGIDLTPFIDVVFMLLLFFVVSTTLFKGATELDVQLPEANAKARDADKKSIEIGVDVKGNYFLNGKPIGNDSKHLKAALRQLAEKESLPLVVVGDKAAPYQAVIYALEVAGECGITQVQIMAQKGA